jgi:hypothetical protein
MLVPVHFRRLRLTAALLAAGLLGFCASARAQILLGDTAGVDISDANGTSPNWTLITEFDTPVSLLNLSNGDPFSGANVTLSQQPTAGGINDLSGTADGSAITDAPQPVITDGAYNGAFASSLTITITGLDPSLLYSLEIYSLSNINGQDDVPYINGVATTWPSGFETRVDRYNQTTGAFFYNVQSDGSGTLSFGIEDDIDSNPVFNALTITAVPEPGFSALLAGLALPVALLLRRKSR